MSEHVHDNACRTQDLYCPDRTQGGDIVIRTNADRDFWNRDCIHTKVAPTLHEIIENHRAVCTATADQIADLEQQLLPLMRQPDPVCTQRNEQLQAVRKDAQQQLDSARAIATLFTPKTGADRADQAEAEWRLQNPGISAVLDS